jgi:hypothetical protein
LSAVVADRVFLVPAVSSCTVPQGNNGRRRGVLVLDIWDKAAAKPKVTRTRSAPAAGSWRATPYASQPASSADVSDASSAAARSFYSLMNGNGQHSSSNGNGNGQHSSSSIAAPTDSIYNPVHSHQPDPSVMQLWTDKPRFSSHQQAYGAENQQHHDPWRQQQQPQPQQPRIFVPPPPSHATSEEFARWQALQSVMAALQHSSGVYIDRQSVSLLLSRPAFLHACCHSVGCAEMRAHTCMQLHQLPCAHGASTACVCEQAVPVSLTRSLVCPAHVVLNLAAVPAELDHWVDDPTDPRMLAADRRLAALTASLGSDSPLAAAMV